MPSHGAKGERFAAQWRRSAAACLPGCQVAMRSSLIWERAGQGGSGDHLHPRKTSTPRSTPMAMYLQLRRHSLAEATISADALPARPVENIWHANKGKPADMGDVLDLKLPPARWAERRLIARQAHRPWACMAQSLVSAGRA